MNRPPPRYEDHIFPKNKTSRQPLRTPLPKINTNPEIFQTKLSKPLSFYNQGKQVKLPSSIRSKSTSRISSSSSNSNLQRFSSTNKTSTRQSIQCPVGKSCNHINCSKIEDTSKLKPRPQGSNFEDPHANSLKFATHPLAVGCYIDENRGLGYGLFDYYIPGYNDSAFFGIWDMSFIEWRTTLKRKL